jgi:uncharacterized protein (TIGR00252 family)
MNTTNTGHEAEAAASTYLAACGFTIMERNYRTPRCEIDIITRKGKCIYFVEVKYRSRPMQGTGLEYVTARKQKQMQFAAEVWIREHDWHGDVTLSAIEVTGPDFVVGSFIESIY